MLQRRWFCALLLTGLLVIEPSVSSVNQHTGWAALGPVEFAETIFLNGMVITMEQNLPLAQAIAICDGRIQGVGSNSDILALRGPHTAVVDLQGHAVLPGFIDGHTHVLRHADRLGRSLAEAQAAAIRYGFTTVNEMSAEDAFLESLMRAESEGQLQLRVNVFASYNAPTLDDSCRTILLETWFPEHGPILDPDRLVRIPGIKVFVDGAFTPGRGCWALTVPLPPDVALANGCGSTLGDLYLSQSELNGIVLQAQNAGFRVSFHAMGDRAIDTVLNAIEYALQGRPNADYRHQIQHNSLLRPDQLARYQTLGIIASVRGYNDWSDLQDIGAFFGELALPWYVNRYALPGLGIHAYAETDFAWTVDPDDRSAVRCLDPIMWLYGIVTHRFVGAGGAVRPPDPSVPIVCLPVERALQMLTIEPAYAVSMEDYVGSIRPGKYADFIVLSDNPLLVPAASLKDVRVLMTMIGGDVEYCAPGHEALCPARVVGAAGSGCAPEQALYHEDFEDGQAQGWDLGTGWSTFKDSDAKEVLRGVNHHFAWYRGTEWEDFTANIRLKIIQGNLHVCVRATDDCVRYFIGFTEEGVYLSKTQPCGTHSSLRSADQPHQLGRWYTLTITCRGSRIEVDVDGVNAISFVDPSPLLRGQLALETLGNSEFHVGDIAICP